MSRYMVTGCAGFIGSTLTDALLKDGLEVVGIDCLTGYYPRHRKEQALDGARRSPNFSFHEVDLTTTPLAELASGVNGIFHCAAQPGVRASWGESFEDYTVNNLLATQRVLHWASELGIRVVFASSSSIYGNAEAHPTNEDVKPLPISPYGVTKLACEHLLNAYVEGSGLDAVTLRYFTVYGPRQRPDMAFSRMIDALLAGRPFRVFGDGRQSRDFTFIDDAVRATTMAMREAPPGAVYNVGGGSEATLREVIATIEELGSRSLDVEYGEKAAGDARRTLADISRIRAELRWSPATHLRDGLLAQLQATRPPLPEPARQGLV